MIHGQNMSKIYASIESGFQIPERDASHQNTQIHWESCWIFARTVLRNQRKSLGCTMWKQQNKNVHWLIPFFFITKYEQINIPLVQNITINSSIAYILLYLMQDESKIAYISSILYHSSTWVHRRPLLRPCRTSLPTCHSPARVPATMAASRADATCKFCRRKTKTSGSGATVHHRDGHRWSCHLGMSMVKMIKQWIWLEPFDEPHDFRPIISLNRSWKIIANIY